MAQIALVTGAAAGLGWVIAQTLLQQGFKVVLTDKDAAAVAVAASTAAQASGVEADSVLAWPLDVTQPADFERALAAVLAHWGGLHVVVNNAAMTQTTKVMAISAAEFDQVTQVNQRGTFLACQCFGQYLAAQGYGRIVNMASLAGQNGGTATGAHYAASKGAIITLTKVFAKELAASGVTVNAVSPGPMDSPAVHRAVPAEQLAQIVQNIPVQRLGDMAFIGQAVALLASPAAGFTTGATWDINGGLWMR
ncbi:MAG: SDR family oxidoreductase [Neisseriaceae bacterium]|nr:SDR family oxidoreductase [Neisseriaceae bacterium]